MDYIESTRLDNIFYADMFVIGGKGCLFFGHGKSKAGQVACQSEENEIAKDFVCLTRDNNQLYGHFEMQVRSKEIEDPIAGRRKLDYLVRCLDDCETQKIFGDNRLEVKKIDQDSFVKMSKFNITFAASATSQLSQLGIGSNNRRLNPVSNFEKLVQGVDLKFIIIPWMNSHSDKGKLIADYVNSN